jgi:hypothetical protein
MLDTPKPALAAAVLRSFFCTIGSRPLCDGENHHAGKGLASDENDLWIAPLS